MALGYLRALPAPCTDGARPLDHPVGPDVSSDMLRRSARCGQCGGKGATIQIPQCGGLQTPGRGWPGGATLGVCEVVLSDLCLPAPCPLASTPGLDRVGYGGELALYLAGGVQGVFNSCDLQGRQAHPSLAFEDPAA